jgi:hypothetical protein
VNGGRASIKEGDNLKESGGTNNPSYPILAVQFSEKFEIYMW